MAKNIASISGFPEWLPAERLVELQVLDTLRETFELHGFSSLETRAVEPVSQLLRKGETSKEIYLLSRLQDSNLDIDRQMSKGKRLGLHFDLTVPFARFVNENAGHLVFPFKRYQIQKVWRGERPQDGRFREFIQADIDVVGQGELAFHHEVELALVMGEALSKLGLPAVTIRVNNRKIVQGICEGAGIEQVEDALRCLDKLDKIGADQVREELESVGIRAEQADVLLKMAQISGSKSESIVSAVTALGYQSELLDEGLAELRAMLEEGERRAPGLLVADLKIARGLDYYTGTVYESFIEGHEDLGSICSGGRYDNLIGDGKKKYPGVGLSIGVSRVLSRIMAANLLVPSRPVPTVVYVAVNDEEHRGESNAIAAALRARGISTDVADKAAKFGKQIKAADRRGIPFVWFPGDVDEVKDIRSGEQVVADCHTWEPPQQDLKVQVLAPPLDVEG
ncbi:histidine--tRNA ligase [Boudabousia marimammalium]|uniref:Histidine--tRNA ligase n=1 Tax=Boudabousia marimammalium TaxID=156892 RepID=A0A1Q5PR13_9ACTO|nr:histidine--tRNA ligase [Boudabousia marimammalium]OKL49976.1 histidine--tRNA ligase [Boudabousia marimammalium]